MIVAVAVHFNANAFQLSALRSCLVLQMLSTEEMKEVLTKPKNALCKQYKQLFTASNTDFKTTPEALQEVAVAACKRNSGARGLRSILELLLQDALYEVIFSSLP